MKLAGNDDSITLKCENEPNHLTITFENTKTQRNTEFNLNLIQLDTEHLGIPETEFSSQATLSSSEFSKICKELHALSEAGRSRLFYDHYQSQLKPARTSLNLP